MADNLTPDKRKTYSLWAVYTMRSILKAIQRQKVGFRTVYTKSGQKKILESTSSLKRSIGFRIFNAAGGDVEKIEFFFNYYATFVDLGVGRGHSFASQSKKGAYDKRYNYRRQYAEQDPLKADTKPPKPFMLPIFNQEVYILSNIIVDRYEEFIQYHLFTDRYILE